MFLLNSLWLILLLWIAFVLVLLTRAVVFYLLFLKLSVSLDSLTKWGVLVNSASPLLFVWMELFSVRWLKPWVKSFAISCKWFSASLSDLLLFSFLLPSFCLFLLTIIVSVLSSIRDLWRGNSHQVTLSVCGVGRDWFPMSVWLGRKYGLNCCFWVMESVNTNNLLHLLVNRVRSGSLARLSCSLVLFWKTPCCCCATSLLLWLKALFVMCAFV